jgi:UrcA family protein
MTTVTNIHARASRPKLAVMMLVCGIAGAASIGAANAAAGDADVLSTTVQYNPANLATDLGARHLYQQIVKAAAVVCPQDASHPHWVSTSVQECRQQSIARAVMKINNPKLVAVYSTSSKNG